MSAYQRKSDRKGYLCEKIQNEHKFLVWQLPHLVIMLAHHWQPYKLLRFGRINIRLAETTSHNIYRKHFQKIGEKFQPMMQRFETFSTDTAEERKSR